MRDYRRFLSAHLEFLTGLCQLSILQVNNSIYQFYSSLFVSTRLLSDTAFHERINASIEQIKSNTPKTFARLLFLIQSINHGNGFVSIYGTNFEYIAPWLKHETYVPTQAIIYDNECSCGLYQNCTSQASFIRTNSSESVPIKGLKIGCTPSESFRASTLECFYDLSCVNLIEEYTNYTNNINSTNFPTPLSANMSRFSINTTMAEIINDLFVDNWATTINYSSYFKQCSPLLCSYTYIQKLNSLYTVTLLLGLEGGLTIVLKWICPKIVRIVAKVYQHRKRRMNIIEPAGTGETTIVGNVNTSVHNPPLHLESMPTSVTYQYASFIFIRFIVYSSLFQKRYSLVISMLFQICLNMYTAIVCDNGSYYIFHLFCSARKESSCTNKYELFCYNCLSYSFSTSFIK
jgi:hypothetical protein